MDLLRRAWHELPYSFKSPFYVRHRMAYWRMAGCVFVHVPKAAGTSVSHALYGRSLGHIKAREIKKYARSFYEKSYSFSLVRNPWDRAVSAYHFAIQGGTETAGLSRPEQYQSKEFESFESFVLEWLSKKNLAQLDPIFQKQCSYLCENGSIIVDHVGKVENFNHELNILRNKIGASVDVGNLNRSNREGGYRSYYNNKEVIDMVGRIYEDDVSIFDYDY